MKIYNLLFFIGGLLQAAPYMPMLYGKNLAKPTTTYEVSLVEHAKESLHKAFALESKLTGTAFCKDAVLNIWSSDTPSDHLLNNLCNLSGAHHLHVGLLRGGSFVAALYGNEEILGDKIGVDWFQEYPKEMFDQNCAPYLNPSSYQIINGSCFDLDKALFIHPIDIYFYDADHSLMAHQKAFTYYDDLFADVFIAVVDDWDCPWIRRPTFKAFEKLHYQVLFEAHIPGGEKKGTGQYLAVLRRSIFPK
jgi:hypothetical protein